MPARPSLLLAGAIAALSPCASPTIADNWIQQAGQHSVALETLAGGNLCIARFAGNTSVRPKASGSGGVNLNASIAGGSILSFIQFASLLANNLGFDQVTAAPTSQPSTCP